MQINNNISTNRRRQSMRYKIGGRGKLQPYDEGDGQYTDKQLKAQGDVDFDTLFDVYEYPPTSDTDMTISFPNKDKHTLDYYRKFVEFVGMYRLFGEASIRDSKIEGYLFKKQNDRDKSKFMMEVLGYPNSQEGWNLTSREILNGTDFHMMIYDKKHPNEHITIAVDTIIHNMDGKIYKVKTIWQLHEDLTLTFVTLIPGGKKKNG